MISRTAQYALRALSHLAERQDGPWLLSRQIAEELELPPPYLAKILRNLTNEGLLESHRGKRGGFRLSRHPGEITVLQIVDPFDHFTAPRTCLLGQARCDDQQPCPLHHEWKGIFDRFVRMLENTSLADVVHRREGGSFPRPGPGARWRDDQLGFVRV